MIARVEYPALDAARIWISSTRSASEARRRVADAPATAGEAPPEVDPDRYAQVMALNDYLFGELRFVGNEVHYEDPRNSFLNEVLERRTGIPITLALLYMEVARRAGLHVEGINFPGPLPAPLPGAARAAVRRGSDHRRVPRRRAAVARAAAAALTRGHPADDDSAIRRASIRGCCRTPPSRRSSRGCC